MIRMNPQILSVIVQKHASDISEKVHQKSVNQSVSQSVCQSVSQDTDDSQDSRGREGTIFYSNLPLPPAHEHSDIYFAILHMR